LQNLHEIGLIIKDSFDLKIEEVMKCKSHLFHKNYTTPLLEVHHGDFLNFDWSNSSVLFANSTCFSHELMLSLSRKAEETKKGTFFITFTKKLPELSENWMICEGFRRLMSWGIATIYIHLKIN
jgi:hypothetical protein